MWLSDSDLFILSCVWKETYRWQTLQMLNDGKNCYIILNQEHKQRKSTVQEEQEVPRLRQSVLVDPEYHQIHTKHK